jgi:hypothetical protein
MLDITPKSKIAEVIQEYPELKQEIINLAPPFKKLRNPLLLKTIARVTTLSQAARVGGIDLVDFVNALRAKVGQAPFQMDIVKKTSEEPPFWFKTGTVVKSIDARPMLDQGEIPVTTVLQEIKDMAEGEILEVITPFIPAPLLDKVAAQNCHVWSRQKSAADVRNYFSPKS